MKMLTLAAVACATAMLAGCAPMPAPDAATSTPTPTPSAATPATSPTPEPLATDPLSGTCDELLTADQVATLLSPLAESRGDLTGEGDGGRAATEPEILALMPASGRHCTWAVPDSDGGIVVSVLPASASLRGAVEAATATYFTTDAGPGVTYHSFESLDGLAFTETHALGDRADYWVAVFTTGTNAREIAQIVWEELIGT